MPTITCPYCASTQELEVERNHGSQPDQTYDQECNACEKTYVFQVDVIFEFDTFRAPCMNGEPHNFEPTRTHPVSMTKMVCEWCDARRRPTADEMKVMMDAHEAKHPKIWALFSIDNEFNQPDNNLWAWWKDKPTVRQLADVLDVTFLTEIGCPIAGKLSHGGTHRHGNRDFRLEELSVGYQNQDM